MNSSQAAVDVARLNVSRGNRRVLHGLDFGVARGRITGLLGPSGCGKTTLMRAIVGVQIVESGEVRVLGEPTGSPAVRARVGYVMQAPAVYRDPPRARTCVTSPACSESGPTGSRRRSRSCSWPITPTGPWGASPAASGRASRWEPRCWAR